MSVEGIQRERGKRERRFDHLKINPVRSPSLMRRILYRERRRNDEFHVSITASSLRYPVEVVVLVTDRTSLVISS